MNRNLQINLICVVLILLAVVLGCSDSDSSGSDAKKPEKKVPAAYLGTWTAQDGSTVTIRNDGSGDYKSGGTSVSGATIEIDEAKKEIRYTFMGFDSGKYKIDEPPKGNIMRLNGMEYRRAEKFSDEDVKNDSDEDGKAPTDAELSALAGETITNLDRAIQQGDFSEFYPTVSEMMRKKLAVEDFNRAFANIIAQKNRYKLKAGAPLTFTSKPVLSNEGNTFDVEGRYETTIKGGSVPFQLRYVRETGGWKTLGVELNPDSPLPPEK